MRRSHRLALLFVASLAGAEVQLGGNVGSEACLAFHAFHKSAGFTVIKTLFKEPRASFNMSTKVWRTACQEGACHN